MASPADAFGDAVLAQPDDFRPVIVALSFIAALMAASVAVGQLFVGPRGLRRTGYDMEAFVVRKCGVCDGIDEAVPVQQDVVSPVKKKKEKGFVELGDGAEEVEPSEPPKDDDEESGSFQTSFP